MDLQYFRMSNVLVSANIEENHNIGILLFVMVLADKVLGLLKLYVHLQAMH